MMMKHSRAIAALAVLGAFFAGAAGTAGPAWADEYILKDGKWVAAPKPAKGTVEGELALIRQQIEAKDYKAATAAADQFRKDRSDSPSCEEAMLLGAQAQLGAGMYYQAFERLEAMLAKFPNGLFLERALTREVEVANAFLAGKKRVIGKIIKLPARDEGLTILRKVSEHAPGTDIAERAMLRIGEYHFERKEYSDAAGAYDEFITLNPKSARVPHAIARAAEAMFESFKGVAYDETPLVEAEARYKSLLAQYPDEARKARATETLREIVAIRGERAFETAKFYERTGRPKSARFYYRQVVEEFPSTVWATEARTKVSMTPKPAPARPAAAEAKTEQKPEAKPAAPAAEAAPDVLPPAVITPAPKVEAKPEPKPQPEPEPEPEAKPATAPAPEPKPEAKPPSTAPAAPVDLEKLANPSPKGKSK